MSSQGTEARAEILRSIRSHLAESVIHDQREAAGHPNVPLPLVTPINGDQKKESVVELFKESLEAVDGHCVVAHNETEIVQALTKIIADLQKTRLRARCLAISDRGSVGRLVQMIDGDVDELEVTPSAADLFRFDVGITTAQAGIAETGTLVLDSSQERHRLVSLVPPVHIAILDSNKIYRTLGETLSVLHSAGAELSPIITFVSGPSRTADIELTLAIGVHGPQELFVIVNDAPPLS